MIKRITGFLFTALVLIVVTSSIQIDDAALLAEYEAESLVITGNYHQVNDTFNNYIKVMNNDYAEFNITTEINEECALWMHARISESGETSIYVNNEKVSVKNSSYYFKWIKLAELDSIDSNLVIKLENNNTITDIDSFCITLPDTGAFNNEYAINDLSADIVNNQIKILFSGINLKYAYVQLFRNVYETCDEYADGSLINGEELVCYKTISNSSDYFIIDENAPDGYNTEYYLIAESCFGESLVSKKLLVEYSSTDNIFLFENIEDPILNTTSFTRNKNQIINENGLIKNARNETSDEKKLFMDTNELVYEYPDFLQNSYFFMGSKNNENVRFNINEWTNVYVYVTNIDKCFSEYYFSKGFQLFKIPVPLTDECNEGCTWFFHKKYRPGTGDAIYLQNRMQNNSTPLSICPVNNDLYIYFDKSSSSLAAEENIYFQMYSYDSTYCILQSQLESINSSVYYYKITDGALNYDYLTFKIYAQEDNIIENSNWVYEPAEYANNDYNITSNVVFFKENDRYSADVDFSDLYHSGYQGLEGYILDDGSVYSIKGNNLDYGMNQTNNVIEANKKSNDNVTGWNNDNYLVIEYDSLNTDLIDSDYVRMVYSFDNWSTSDDVLMNITGNNKYYLELYPSGYSNKIYFYFTDDTNTDDNEGAKWIWNYSRQQYYNIRHVEDLAKRNYLELLPCAADGTNDYEWSINLENGIYDISLIAKKLYTDDNALIRINSKTFNINDPHNEIYEIRDKVLVYNNRIFMKNIGDTPVNIYSIQIKKDKNLINKGIFSPDSLKYDRLLLDEEITEDYIIFEDNEEVIKTTFILDENLAADNKLELSFNASTNNINNLYIALSDDFENDLIGKIRLNNDIKTYTIDLSEYIDIINADNNELTLYIKAHKGAKFFTHYNEESLLELKSYVVLDEDQEPYQGMGEIAGTMDIFFTDLSDNKVYMALSDVYDLSEHKDMLVMVSGYIEDNIVLHILDIQPVLEINSIEGDTYTSKQELSWNVFSDQEITHLKYRIKELTDWTTISYDTITEEITDEGEYILEVIPLMNGNYGAVYSHNFTVDRSGPELSVNDLPEFVTGTDITIDVIYTDTYDIQENISIFCIISINKDNEYTFEEERELTIIDSSTATLNLEDIPSWDAELNFYAKDSLDNEGIVVTKNTFLDFFTPVISSITYSYNDNTTDEEIIPVIDFFPDYIENLDTDEYPLTLYYKTSNDEETWNDTTNDVIELLISDFETDGEYTFSLYAQDYSGLISEEKTIDFTIDRVPIDKPSTYETFIEDDYIKLTWESKSDDTTFRHYEITREPAFENEVTVTDNYFIDYTSLYDPDFIYYINVVDIYGNVSETLECPAMKYETVEGEIGEEVTLDLEYGTFKLIIGEDTPEKIGVIKRNIELDDHIKGEYGLYEDKIYHFEPSGSMFNKPAVWTIDPGELEEDTDEYKEKLKIYYHNIVRNKWEEVSTKYNSLTGYLEAKIYHFSDYG